MVGHRDFGRVFVGKTGLEVGGPSRFFARQLPLYRVAQAIDQLNFSADTVWSLAHASEPGPSSTLALARPHHHL